MPFQRFTAVQNIVIAKTTKVDFHVSARKVISEMAKSVMVRILLVIRYARTTACFRNNCLSAKSPTKISMLWIVKLKGIRQVKINFMYT